MKFLTLEIPEIKLVKEYVNHNSINGYRANTFSWTQLRQHGITGPFIYESEIRIEHENTLKGLYYQDVTNREALLVRCLSGSVMMKIVDIRPKSKTYRKVVNITLREEECSYVYIPYGFAHGFLTTRDDSYLQYKSDNCYLWKNTKVINCLDSLLGLVWPKEEYIMSARDRYAPCINEVEKDFFIEKADERLEEEQSNGE